MSSSLPFIAVQESSPPSSSKWFALTSASIFDELCMKIVPRMTKHLSASIVSQFYYKEVSVHTLSPLNGFSLSQCDIHV